jgi:hypothetical protein
MMEKMEQRFTVYRNAGYSIVPLIAGLVLRNQEGKELAWYPLHAIEQAVEEVDRMAIQDGDFACVSV